MSLPKIKIAVEFTDSSEIIHSYFILFGSYLVGKLTQEQSELCGIYAILEALEKEASKVQGFDEMRIKVANEINANIKTKSDLLKFIKPMLTSNEAVVKKNMIN